MIFLIFTDFNPRSDERSDCTRQAVPSAFLYFNPRSDERSDSVATSAYNVPFYFNPRSDERSDKVSRETFFLRLHFNPRSDERSDPALSPVLAPQIYFNPRSDERSDTHNSRRRVDAEISIHAPTNGATHITLLLIWLVVFQSTLRRTERRELTFEPLSLCLYFNPRSDERSDHVVLTSAP